MTIFKRFHKIVSHLALAAGLVLAGCGISSPPTSETPGIKTHPFSISYTTPEETEILSPIRFERITPADGLSHPYVRSIIQDHLGFMWFATTNGLNLYDGYEFTIFRNKPGDRTSLDFDDLSVVYEDTDGILWVGGAGGVDRFDRTEGTFSRLDEHGQVFNIIEGQDGTLWVGFWHGLYGYDRSTSEKISAYSSELGLNADPNSMLRGYIYAAAEDSQGTLWIGTSTGLYQFSPQTGSFQRYAHEADNPTSLQSDTVVSVFVDSDDRVWIGTQQGLDRLDKSSGEFLHYKFTPEESGRFSAAYITSILEDKSGILWIGTLNGIIRYLPKNDSSDQYLHDTASHSLSNNIVFSLYEDPTGVIWIGTANGISKYIPEANQFSTIHSLYEFVPVENFPPGKSQLYPDFSEMKIESILEDQEGHLWLGTMVDGLFRIDSSSGSITAFQNDPANPNSLHNNHVSAIFQDSSGNLWIGTGTGWLEKYTPQTQDFIHVDSVDAAIVSINEDPSGRIWIGTQGKGIASLNPGEDTISPYLYMDPAQFSGANKLSSHIVTSVLVDHSGIPWIGTYHGGINLWSEDQFSYYRHDPRKPNSLSHNYVLSFYEEPDRDQGVMWIGTMGGGLNRLDLNTQSFTRYTTEQGLADDIVTCILSDETGSLWLSTAKGLTRFDPASEIFSNFNEQDGVPNGSILPGACLQRADHTLLFTTPDGIISFNPEQIQVNPHIPPIAITTITVNGVPIHKNVVSDLEITLPYNENSLTFEFAALDYVSSKENTYAYQMAGLNEAWIQAGTRRLAEYPNLNPGTYTFQVQGSNNDGTWNEQGLAVRISIAPPFWQSWWFLGVAGLAAAGIIYAGFRRRMHSLEMQRQELEILVRDRTAEINQRRRQIEALYDADENLYRHLDLDQVLQALVDTAVQLLGADKGSLLCWDEKKEYLVIRAARNFKPNTIDSARIPRGQGIAGRVAESGQTAVVENTEQDPNVTQSIVQPEQIRSFIQVPIKTGAEVFGVFSTDYTAARTFNEEEKRLLAALAQRAANAIQNAQLFEQAQELAATQERNRLARDLHDAVTQTLFSASLIAEALPILWERSPDKGRDRLAKLRQLNRGALAEMRTLLLELRPTALMESNLEDLLRQLGEAATGRTGIPVNIQVVGLCKLPAELHLSLYRIAQEALNNAIKHAKASHIQIELTCTSRPENKLETVTLVLTDDGQGFDIDQTAPEKLGLGIMRERAQAIGAELLLESKPGRGTRVKLIWMAGQRHPTDQPGKREMDRP